MPLTSAVLCKSGSDLLLISRSAVCIRLKLGKTDPNLVCAEQESVDHWTVLSLIVGAHTLFEPWDIVGRAQARRLCPFYDGKYTLAGIFSPPAAGHTFL